MEKGRIFGRIIDQGIFLAGVAREFGLGKSTISAL